MRSPLVTIIIPTYNRAAFIGETIKSINNQKYPFWECLIVDDQSSDNTKTVIEELTKNDPRYFYFLRPGKYKKGAAGTRNFGLDIARERNAQFIQFFDDDDIMHPLKLNLQIEPFLKDPTLNLTICKFDKLVEMKAGEKRVEKPDYNLDFDHLGDAVLTGALKMNSLSAIWKMEILDKFRFDERLNCSEEWELFTRIGYNYPKGYAAVDEYLFSYRKHPNTLTMGPDLNYEKRKTSAVIRVILMNYLSNHRLHTKASIKFFSKTFLLYSYEPSYVQNLLIYMEEEKFSRKSIIFLKLTLKLTKFFKGLVTRMVNRI